MRIVSLVPSITELLYSLGLEAEVVAITKFCVHPKAWHQSKTHIGGTKNIRVEKIQELTPSLVIASKEENVREQVEACALFSEVLLTDVQDFEGALSMILEIARRTNRSTKGEELVAAVKRQFARVLPRKNRQCRAAYLIWQHPYMTVGADTFISDMMTRIGLENVYKEHQRYPQTSIAELKELQPDLILLSSEPYPFKNEHVVTLQKQLPESLVCLVDGEYFSWYGSRMLGAADYFQQLPF